MATSEYDEKIQYVPEKVKWKTLIDTQICAPLLRNNSHLDNRYADGYCDKMVNIKNIRRIKILKKTVNVSKYIYFLRIKEGVISLNNCVIPCERFEINPVISEIGQPNGSGNKIEENVF